jgi:hypothetical protein
MALLAFAERGSEEEVEESFLDYPRRDWVAGGPTFGSLRDAVRWVQTLLRACFQRATAHLIPMTKRID